MKYSNMQETKTSTSTEYHTPMTREVKSIRELQEMIALGQPLVNLAFQNMDLTSLTDTLINSGIRESLFLGCLLENRARSEEHTSELQSRGHLVCRLLLEKNK